jgi:archaellum biogenesis ATPase FlaH
VTASLSKEPFKASSKKLPCPICGRTEDGDCRIAPDFVLCHIGSSRQPPTQKKGAVVPGEDGQDWACKGIADDGRTVKFAPDKPLPKALIKSSLKPCEPAASEISLALLPPDSKTARGNATASGIFYLYGPLLQVHRREENGKKQGFGYWHRTEALHKWISGGGDADWPAYNEEAATQYGEGKYILEVEGEKCCDIASSNGIVCISQPGNYKLRTTEEITKRYERLKKAGIKGIVYIEDNDGDGAKKGLEAESAAKNAGIFLRAINARTIWPEIPEKGSLDDLPDLSNTVQDIQAAANRPVVERVSAKTANNEKQEEPRKKEGGIIEETNEKQATLKRLVDEIVMARIDGDGSRDAVLMSQTWQMGIPSDTTNAMVLERWKELNNIGTSSSLTAPVRGRKIGDDADELLTQLIPGFVQEKGMVLIAADAGAGKSYMSLVMAHRLINGGGFLDQQEGPARKGNVLYIGSDMGSTAFTTLKQYAQEIAEDHEWGGIEFWCEEAGTRKAWCLSLYNLELLRRKLNEGDIDLVIIDTCNAIFQLAGVSPYTGPVDHFLRLLKDLVCSTSSLVLLHHTNRNGSGIKSIGGHPAYQEVPDAIHRIEALKKQDDQELIYKWHVEKLRGESKRSFSYESVDGELKVVDGHFYTNCGDKLLIEIKKRTPALDSKGLPLLGNTTPKELAIATGELPSSVRTALTRLRQNGLLRKKGKGVRLTAKGEARLIELEL